MLLYCRCLTVAPPNLHFHVKFSKVSTLQQHLSSTSSCPCQCYPPSIPSQDGNNILLYWPEGILVPVPVHLHHLGAAIVPENVVIVISSIRSWRKIGKDEVWLTRVDKCYWIAAQMTMSSNLKTASRPGVSTQPGRMEISRTPVPRSSCLVNSIFIFIRLYRVLQGFHNHISRCEIGRPT